MTVSITLIDVGSAPDDGLGDPARTGGQAVNTSLTNLKNAAEALQGQFWTIQNSSTTVALGGRYLANNHAGITLTMPAVFAMSATSENTIWVANADNASDVTLTPASGDALFVDGVTLGVDVSYVLGIGVMAILSPRTTSSEWDVMLLGRHRVGRETIFVPAQAIRPSVTNGAGAIADLETTAGRPDITGLSFIAASDTYGQFQIEYPKRWNQGTLTFKAAWESAATGTTGVAIALQAVAVSDGDTYDVVYGTPIVVTDDAQSTPEDRYVTAESAAMTVAGTPADDDVIMFQVFRDVSDANDDMTEPMILTGIRIFYTTSAGTDA